MVLPQQEIFNSAPLCITGPKAQESSYTSTTDSRCELKIDWVAFTCASENQASVLEVLLSFFSCKLSVVAPVPTRGYSSASEYDDGFKLSWAENRPEVHFQISGSRMGILGLGEQFALVRALVGLGFHNERPVCSFTRIDLCIDDFAKKVQPSQMFEWSKSGWLCGLRKYAFHQEGKELSVTGNGFYAGSRGSNGSGKYYRAYDKELESEGRIKAIRHEIEFSSDACKAVAVRLSEASSPEKIAACFSDLVYGSIDFRYGDNKRRAYAERPRVQEWFNLVNDVIKFKYARPKKKAEVDFPFEHFKKQWGNSLAKLISRVGIDRFVRFISECVEQGHKNGFGQSVPIESRLMSFGLKSGEINKCKKVLAQTREFVNRYSSFSGEKLCA